MNLHRFYLVSTMVSLVVAASIAGAQQSNSSRPTVGLRSAEDSAILLSGGEVVVAPGESPQRLEVLIQGTSIVAVGETVEVPAGTLRRDVTGKRIYAGLIDAMHDVALPADPPVDSTGYWNANITPQYRAAWVASDATSDAAKLRSQGITAQLLAPKDGIVKGTSCVVLLVDPKHAQRLLRPDVFQHATLTVPRGKSRDRYPDSPMGATALLRQSLYDARWYRDARRIYERQRELSRPEPNIALETLSQTIDSETFVFDAANERMAIRAANVADEFTLKFILRGSGHEYRAITEIAHPGRMILLPVDFPETPNTATSAVIRDTPLVDWMHWHLAPENPKRLHDVGLEFCLTTDGLDDPSKFLKQVRLAVSRGLEPSIALASLTTTPAKLLGVDHVCGKVQTGMLANLVITDGDLFDDDTKVDETWIAGERFKIGDEVPTDQDILIGSWTTSLSASKKPIGVTIKFEKKDKSIAGTVQITSAKPKSEPSADDENAAGQDDEKAKVKKQDKKPSEAGLKNLVRQRERLSASVELHALDDAFPTGISLLTLLTIDDASDKVEPVIIATLTTPDGLARSISLKRVADEPKSQKTETTGAGDSESDAESDSDTKSNSASEAEKAELKESASVATGAIQAEPIEVVYPLGAYGLSVPPARPSVVLFRGATVWTCGPQGKIEEADVLVRDGKIAEVGYDLTAPKSAVVIKALGKHITPGLIDCHSHVATDGGVNESGQTITSAVRIGDFIDNTDIGIFRHLAGGVTTSNILHGSANPIGGQNQVLKFRWGESMTAMKFAGAPAGIKFALGENVKRSSSRYPSTRMGVEQILRDQFLAARQYDADRKAWEGGQRDNLPPRRDLQLDALVEIQQGQRWVHCHSYRQDEIVATLDVLEEFNIQIGTLQHILEGYKVADRIAAHGAMASSFADWWAYKFEVFDAIPYNGVLMHDAGVVVSFNSDDPELARHLNTEAAKATKYGGVPEQEALKFVTLNPAKQLRIDDRVGSIEVGKDADLVIWSGRPLSTTSRCEQTWIDGRQYFSLEIEQQLRGRDEKLKARLVQLAVEKKPAKDAEKKPEEKEEADRWIRFDIFCNAAQNRGDHQE